MCSLFMNCYEQRTINWFVFYSWNKYLAFVMTVNRGERGESCTEWDVSAVSESRRSLVSGSGRPGLPVLLSGAGSKPAVGFWYACLRALWAC